MDTANGFNDSATGQGPVAASLTNAFVKFGAFTAIENLTLDIEEGAFYTILGPSGCGKSTLLRLISDLVPCASGELTVLGKTTEEARLAREFAFVFQDAALLPWRTAIQNVELPLEIGRKRGVKIPVSDKSPAELLELVGLKGRENALPHELSGGMRQRVAIARALVSAPDFIYFDEPFTALDVALKRRMQDLVIAATRPPCAGDRAQGASKPDRSAGAAGRFGALFVTHDLTEAARIAHRIAVMHPQGRGIAGLRALPGQPGTRPEAELFALTQSWLQNDPLFRHIHDVDERRIA